MNILFIAMTHSIHTARWISQIADQGWDLHLFPSEDGGVTHPDFSNVTIYHSFYANQVKVDKSVAQRGVSTRSPMIALGARNILKRVYPDYQVNRLARLIRRLKPDIIHSLEIQHAGYLTMAVRKRFTGHFPPWIVTNWGSDIYLYGRLGAHKSRIQEVLTACDYYSCECRRDVCLAKGLGFEGTVLPVFPNTGGFDLQELAQLRSAGLVSDRKIIMLKGYQHFAGRALVGLRALERCMDVLSGYEVVIYSAAASVEVAAELFCQSTGIKTTIIPNDTPHRHIMALHGKARISLGLSISDAISTSLLEAIAMGSFPIQSWTACADEWIEDGVNGLLVPPEDPDIVEQAIRRAVTDDKLVNHAAEINCRLAAEKLEHSLLKDKTIALYTSIGKERGLA